jgi:hypothetical protein
LKHVIIIAIVFVLLIPILVNQVHATEYRDEERRFLINYPTGWDIENEFVSQDGVDYIVTFYDDIDGWTSMLDIRYFPNLSMVQSGTDQQWLNTLNMGIKQSCELSTIEEYGYLCSDHKLIDSRVVYIDEKKSYQLTYSWVETIDDSTQYENTSISTSIPDGYGSWSIYSETGSDKYNFYKRQILISIDTFDILKSNIENSQIFEYQSKDKILFEEGSNSFLEFSNRPISLTTPIEFTPEWYFNTEHDFAIKFPESWKDKWTVNESFSGKKIAEFSSKNTNGKIEFYKEDNNLFQTFEGFDKDRLYKETQAMVTESISKFPGFFHVDALGVVKFSDGYVTGASFFQIDENGESNLHDVSYLIFDNGKTIEVLYYGDNFSAMSFNDYAIMLESSYVDNISTIPIVNEVRSNSEMFVSYDLGFSFIPPKQWKQDDLNTKINAKSAPVTFNAITSFISPNFQGVLAPAIIVLYANLEESLDLENHDEEEFMKGFIGGFKNSLGENNQFEATNSNLEYFDNRVKINLEGIIKVDLDGFYIERQIELVSWMFENGEVYYFALGTDPVDFNESITEFRKSVDTITFKPKPQQVENGGGCLIATATYGSELAPQVQQLRELRDNSLLQTKSGNSFMKSFNEFYYSFSPIIADYERENPVFREMVKVAITPMISSLSILNYVNMDSEELVLGYGISLIILNLGMYFAVPVIVIMKIRK